MTTWTNNSEVTSSYSQSSKNATVWSNQPTAVNHEILIGDGFFMLIGDGFRLLIDPSDLPAWSQATKN